MKFYFSLILIVVAATSFGQQDSIGEIKADTLIRIAADTLGSELQEGGLSVEALQYYNSALQFLESSELDSAAHYFTLALAEEDSFPKALINRAAVYIQQEQHEQAIQDLDEYILLVDTATNAHFFRARSYDILGNLDSAVSAYGNAIERAAYIGEAHLRRAEIYRQRGKYDIALEEYTAALNQDSKNGKALHDRGSCRKLLGDIEGAAEDYRSAVKIDPTLTSAYINLGSIYRTQKKLGEALAEYNQALRLDEDNLLALNNRGYTYFLLEEYENAELDFRKVIDLDAQYAYAYNNLASALIKQERYKEAIDSASDALSIDANYGFAYLNRGIAREMIRDIQGACSDWKIAQEMGIKNADVYQNGPCKY